MLELQILEAYFRTTESKILGMGPSYLCFNKASRDTSSYSSLKTIVLLYYRLIAILIFLDFNSEIKEMLVSILISWLSYFQEIENYILAI